MGTGAANTTTPEEKDLWKNEGHAVKTKSAFLIVDSKNISAKNTKVHEVCFSLYSSVDFVDDVFLRGKKLTLR